MPRYEGMLIEFLEQYKDITSVVSHPRATGVHTHQGRYFSFRNLPPGLVFEELDLSLMTGAALPDRLTVTKKLYLNGASLPDIPCDLQTMEIEISWKDKSGYVWSYKREGGPAQIIFNSSYGVDSAKYHGDSKKGNLSLSVADAQQFKSILHFRPVQTPRPSTALVPITP